MERFFSSLVSRLLLGAIHPLWWVLGVKWSVCKAYHLPPSVVEAKNRWRYTYSAPYAYAFMAYFTLFVLFLRYYHEFSNCIIMGTFSTFSS